MANDPNLDRLIQALSQPSAPEKPPGVGISDFAKEVAGGAAQGLGYGIRGVGEFINAPARSGTSSSRNLLLDATPLINAGNRIAAKGDDLQAGVSEAAKQAIQGSTPEGELLKPSTWSLGEKPSVAGYGLQAANVLGQVAPVLATGAITKGRLIPSAGVAAALGGGAAGAQEQQRIDQMPQAELDKVPGYQQLIAEGATPAQARQLLGERSGSRSALTTMPVSALSAFTEVLPFTGRFQQALGNVVGKSRLARAGAGAVTDAVGEGLQEAAEQSAQTLGANNATGENRSLGEDTFQNALLGAIGGAPLGAVAGLAHGAHAAEAPGAPSSADALTTPPATGTVEQAAEAAGPGAAPQAPAPVAQTAPFTPSQEAVTGNVQVAPGVTVHQNDGPLSKSLVEGARQGAMDRPAVTAMDDGSTVNTETGEIITPPTIQAQAPGPSQTEQVSDAAPENVASVPFMITASMRRDLADRGYDSRAIGKMTPQEANDILAQPAARKADEPMGRPGNDELDAIVSGYYDTYGVIDAQTTGAIARRFGVSRQDVADAKRRLAQAITEQQAARAQAATETTPAFDLNQAPAQSSLELAPTPAAENVHEEAPQGTGGQEVGRAGQEIPSESAPAGTGAEPEQGQAAAAVPQRTAEPEQAAAPEQPAAAGSRSDSGDAAGADRQAGRGSERAAGEQRIGQPVEESPARVQLNEGASDQPGEQGGAAASPAATDTGGAGVQGSNGAVGSAAAGGAPESGTGGAGAGSAKAAPAAPVKWFGTQDKADAYVAKQKLADSHEVVQEGRRFEVRPKAAKAETAAAPAASPDLDESENSRLRADAEYTATLPGKQKKGVPAAELAVAKDADGNYRYAQGMMTGQRGASHSFRGHKGWHSPAYQTAEAARAGGLDAIEKALPKKAENLAEAGQIKRIKEWVAAERAKLTPAPGGGKSPITVRKAGDGAHAIVIDPSATADTETDGDIERGAIGGKYKSGQKLKTSSGRTTTPFPLVSTGTDRQTNATIKRVHKWLMQNALDEAKSRGDDFNARQFEANLEKPSQADRDSAEEYLFGEQPKVVPRITKPLSNETNSQRKPENGNASDTVERKAVAVEPAPDQQARGGARREGPSEEAPAAPVTKAAEAPKAGDIFHRPGTGDTYAITAVSSTTGKLSAVKNAGTSTESRVELSRDALNGLTKGEAPSPSEDVGARWDAMSYDERETFAKAASGGMPKVEHHYLISKWAQLTGAERSDLTKAMKKAPAPAGEVFEQFPTEAKAKAFAATLEGDVKITSHRDTKLRQTWTVRRAPLSAEASPSATVAAWVQGKLEANQKITLPMLSKVANEAFGGTQAEGKYSIKDAYDAMELGVNQWILAHPSLSPAVDAATAVKTIEALQTKVNDTLPTQNKRTAEMDEFQQFSTHPGFAFLANWAANLTNKDTVLEPSAGVGGLAAFAKLAGADVTVNELSERRAAVLKELGFEQVYTENAEQLHNVLPDEVKPTVVVMNPPFSSTAGRVQGQRKTINGGKHIEQALARLEPGGRLVAVVGEGMAEGKPAFKAWWDGIKAKYNVRANLGLPGKEYAKYGTTFDNNLLVIDKTGPTTGKPVTGKVNTLADAVPLLEAIHEREGIEGAGAAEQPAGKSNGGARAAGSESPVAAGQPVPVEPAGVGAGQGENGRELSGEGAGSPRPRERVADAGQGAASVRAADRNARGGGADRAVNDQRADAGSGGGEADAGSGEPGSVVVSERASGQSQTEGGKVNANSTFESYRPQRVEIAGAKPHPGKLVQSAAMAAVEPPRPAYTPNLPKATISEGKLSDAQLESLVYAGQAHAQKLADGTRRGYFIGDGTGVGKGREIGGIILDNLRQGRKKAVWISEKSGLLDDAKRDYKGVGGDEKSLFLQGKTKASDAIDAKDGVLFTTYATLRSGESRSRQEGSAKPKSRMDQIVDWLGEDFDGVIAFDEAHNMGNAVAMKGKRGKTDPSAQALAGVELQKRLPNARVVYVSATGATEVSNLSYATRLGLWGPGTAFPTAESFISEINNGGLAAMELVSRDMKQMGAYLARSLSFDGVTYSRIEHDLDGYQKDVYNELAKAWQVTLRNVHDALGLTGVTSAAATNARAKEAALSAFWGTQQRFFNQVLTAMQMPSVLAQAQKDLAAGHSVVMQLVNTNEAALNRAIASMSDDQNLEDLDLTPRDTLMQYVRNSFPVQQFEEYLDEGGNMQSRPVVDSKGEPVFNKEAIAARDQLLQNLEHIRVPDGPLEMILDAFGADNVAEITGRRNRVVRVTNDEGNQERVQQRRSASNVKADADQFQAGKKRVLVFSDAGGTGFSFHADLTAKNQERRMHYLVQPGWRADKAVQGFGRTHRSNEASQPHYYLATTDLPAHKRFISTIARRLDQLGALTKGQRDANSSGLLSAKDNLEGPYAADAVESLFRDMYQKKIPELPFAETTWAMGFDKLTDKDGALNDSKIPSVPQFLNRLLSLPTDMQATVFDAFADRMEAKVQTAINNGTLDTGMETVQALSTKVLGEQPVYTDPSSGAQTNYVELELTKPTRLLDFPHPDAGFSKYTYVQNKASGRVWAMKDAGSHTTQEGKIKDRVQLYNPTSARVADKESITSDKFTTLTPNDARALWQKEIDAAPKTFTEKSHLITGALLPIWDRLRGSVRVVRVLADDGRRYLGRQINPGDLNVTLKALGASSSESRMSPDQVQAAVLKEGKALELANGWVLERKRVNNENRMEVTRFPTYNPAMVRELQRVGGFMERIQWANRAFLPTGAKGVEALAALTERNPVIGPVGQNAESVDFSKAPAGTAAERAPSGGVDAAALNERVTRFMRKLKNAPVVVQVVSTAADLPSFVRNTAGFDATVEAAHDNGAVYLIADRLGSMARAEQVLAHEIIGHYGVEQILGPTGFKQVTEQIAKLRADGKMADLFKEIDQRYGELAPDKLAGETMAVMAEKGMRNTIMGRVMAAMRTFLRGLGFDLAFNENDLRQIITNAGKYVANGRAKPRMAVQGVSFGQRPYAAGEELDFTPNHVNNASGESSASVEAINRLRDEQASGKVRLLIDANGTVRPLLSVDAVDTFARKGQVIVQRGVGEDEWTPISTDAGMTREQARNMVARVRVMLDTTAEELNGSGAQSWDSNDDELPGIAFSKRPAGDVADEVERASKFHLTDMVQFMRDKREDWRPGWLGMLTLRQLAEVGGRYLPRMQDYADQVQAMQTRRNGLQEEASGVADNWWQWQRKNREAGKVLGDMMHDATLAGVDPAEAFVPGTVTLSSGEVVPMTAQAVTTRAAELEKQAETAPKIVGNILRADADRLRETLGIEQRRRDAYPELKKRFDAMTPEAQRIYRTVRDSYAARADAMQQALIERIGGLELPADERKALADRVRAHFESARVQAPYFPLARFGNYWVAAERDGQKEFRMMENRAQQRRVQGAYAAAGWTTKAGAKIDMARAIDGASSNFMAQVTQTLADNGVRPDVADEIYQLYLRTLPDLSVRKQFIHRKGVAGYDEDALRAYAAHMNHGAYQLARLENTHKMEGMLRSMREDVKALAEEGGVNAVKAARAMAEVDKRHEWVMNPKDAAWVQRVSAANFAYYLGATPAAALVNLTQGAITTFPALAARYGWGKAMAEIVRGMRQSIRTYGHMEKVLTGDELRAHNELSAMGAIDKTRAHDLAGMGEGSMLSYNPGWRRTMGVISHGFHKAEVFNRESAGLAAYRLARAAGETHEEAVRYAADTIYQTHFDYSNANRARFMQSNTAKVLFAFRQYSQHMSYYLWRNFYQSIRGATAQEKAEARRKLLGSLGMTTVFAGAMGLPLMTLMFGVANAFHHMFGDDDEPWDAETEFRNFLVEMLGPSFGKVAQMGPVNALTGIDIANRTKLDQLWFRAPDQELEGRALYDYWLEQAAGPVGGAIGNITKGWGLYSDGHLMRGVETAMPKAVRDSIKTMRYATQGVNTLRGDPLVKDVSPYELLMQAAGFSPAKVSAQYELNNSLMNYEKALTDRRKALMDGYAMAVRMRDADAIRSVYKKIEAFNRANPEIGITAGQIRRSLQAREKYSERAVAGIVLNPKLAAKVKARVGFAEEAGE